VLALALAFAASSVAAETAQPCAPPPDLGDGWQTAAPGEQGLAGGRICALAGKLVALQGAEPHGVVVVRHGKLVHEAYFSGKDQRWPQQHWKQPLVETPHDARTLHDVQSITKSITALLVGVALDRGALPRLDAPVLPLFPNASDLATPERSRITLRDLLTMRAGLSWRTKPYLGLAREVDAARDPYRLVLEQPMTGVPGETWRYNNGTAELVGGVVQRATGLPLDEFAKRALFAPLAIDSWEWGKMASGDPGASWGLRLRPRDLAKIGQLVLNRGDWRGVRVVSPGWIEQMIAPQVVRSSIRYGYLWWLRRWTVDGRDVDGVSAIGWGGQYLDVVPSLDLVIVVTAGVYDFDGGGTQSAAEEAVLDTVLRAIQD